MDTGGINTAMVKFLIAHPHNPTPTEHLVYRLSLERKEYDTISRVERARNRSAGQSRADAGFESWYLPFLAYLRGANEMIVSELHPKGWQKFQHGPSLAG